MVIYLFYMTMLLKNGLLEPQTIMFPLNLND
nr:MAG TPA: hypothetical protein [Caudoviricetes sp.]